jgi:hypothetical protein
MTEDSADQAEELGLDRRMHHPAGGLVTGDDPAAVHTYDLKAQRLMLS